MRGFRSLLVLLGALAVGLPGGLMAAAPLAAADIVATASNTGTIMPGVHVGSIDLSGLDEPTARQVLAQGFASVSQGEITVAADSATSAITYASINRRVDIDALITQAFAVGRNGTATDRLAQVHRSRRCSAR